MQLQEQAGEADAKVRDDDWTGLDQTSLRIQTQTPAMAAKGKVVTTVATPVHFAMRERRKGVPIAMGSLFARTAHLARREAKFLTNQVQQMLRHMMPHVPAASLDACTIFTEPRPLPLEEPPIFALRNEDWLTYAAEVIVRGPMFFATRAPSQVLAEPTRARTAMRESRTDDHVRRILATDPAVRQAWLEGRDISWSLLAGYMPAVRPAARAAIHLTADDEPLALQGCTIAAVLCILLRSNNYARRHGITYHRQGQLDRMPNSAVARAALAQGHRQPSDRRVREATMALACLRRAGLDDLARRIEAQAMAALPAIAP